MPNPTPNRPPLWEVMEAASIEAVFDKGKEDLPVSRVRIAAELRAIANEMIKTARKADIDQDARNWLYRWLLAEADRAEAGES